jgi:RNA polymerase sigma-70 factor (ECF subfamily)
MIFFKKIRFDKLSDSELVSLYTKSGDSEYVGELFTRYSHLVYGVCLYLLKNRDEAKDAVIAIFEQLLKDLKNTEVKNHKAFLHTVARNYCFMQKRGSQRLLRREQIFADGIELETLPAEFEINKEDEDYQILYSAINQLNEEQKICIELFFMHKKSYSEITEITNYNTNQVKSYIQNGKRNLRNFLTSKQ